MIIDQVIEELQKLQKAQKLLERVYAEIGPYAQYKIEESTLSELNDFFEFDDSE